MHKIQITCLPLQFQVLRRTPDSASTLEGPIKTAVVGGGKVVCRGEHKIKSIGGNLATDSDGMPIADAFCPGEKHPNHLFPNGVVSVTFQGAHGYASTPTIVTKVTSNMAGLEKVIESKTGAEHVFYDRFNKSVSLPGTSTPPRHVVAMPRGALSGGMMSATAAEDTSSDPQVSQTFFVVRYISCETLIM